MGAKTQKGKAGRKLRVTLIYPPSAFRNCEAFLMPNPAIAVLARSLRDSGHEPVQKDLDKLWFSSLKNALKAQQLQLLLDKEACRRYAAGEAPPAEAKALTSAADRIIARAGISRSDLFCFTFACMTADTLMLNVSAVLAARLKAVFGAPVAIGYRSIPAQAYMEIMGLYPCFDFASYANWGEESLAGIIAAVGGGTKPLQDTIERAGGELRVSLRGRQPPRAPSPLYDRKILSAYRITDRQILASYNQKAGLPAELHGKPKKHLVVTYSMQLSCPYSCAFCSNDNSKPSDAKPLGLVMDELFELKELGVTGIYFMNSAFNSNYKRAEELCDKMIKYKLGFLWTDCANLWAIDERLIDKMRDAGAVKLTYGIETASPRLLRYISKPAKVEKITRYLQYSHRAGIWNQIELIGGLPTETDKDIRATEEFVRRNKDSIDTYSLNPFFLYRGSRFFREAGKFGLRLHKAAGNEDYFKTGSEVGNFSERFDEAGGLGWEAKNRQIARSTAAVASAIERFASSRNIDFEHVHLLMYLYSKLGHARKDGIRRLMRVLTDQFKPYNLDFKISPDIGFKKHTYSRDLSSKHA